MLVCFPQYVPRLVCVVKEKGTVRYAGIVENVLEKVVRVGSVDLSAHACEEVCGVVVEVSACVEWWRDVVAWCVLWRGAVVVLGGVGVGGGGV